MQSYIFGFKVKASLSNVNFYDGNVVNSYEYDVVLTVKYIFIADLSMYLTILLSSTSVCWALILEYKAISFSHHNVCH